MSSAVRNLRESQRAPLRCTECARRRVRCSKTIPCDNCVKGRIAHKCAREVVLIRGTPMLAGDNTQLHQTNAELIRENSTLRECVARLEAILQGRRQRATLSASQHDVRTPENVKDQGDFEVFSTILEQWNLGVPQESVVKEPIYSAVPEELSSVLTLLPPRPDCNALVRFSLEYLGWIHCALDASTFLKESNEFESALEVGEWERLRNHAWLAVYLSVLTVGLIFMEGTSMYGQLSRTFLDRADLSVLPQLWYRAVLRQLELCDYIGQPGLHTVQAISILNLCSRHLGERQRELTLTQIAITTARCLKMHLLGNEENCPSRIRRMPQWSTPQTRAVGRRLWWSLVICDWLGAAAHPPSISAEGFTTELLQDPDDMAHLLGVTPAESTARSPAPLRHHMALAKMAAIVRSHYTAEHESPEACYDTLSKLDVLEQEDPWAVASKATAPLWDLGQRCHFSFTLNHWRVKVCRILFSPGMEKVERYDEMRECALAAATAISDTSDFPRVYQQTWIYVSATIAAGVFLALDLLKNKYTPGEATAELQKHRVATCIASIAPYSEKTTIARGGSMVLRKLLELIDQCESGEKQADIMQLIIEIDGSGALRTQNFGQQKQDGTWPEAPWPQMALDFPIVNPDTGSFFDEQNLYEGWGQFDAWSLLSGDFVV